MPYIPQEDREKLDGLIEEIAATVDTEGELNYVFSTIASLMAARWGTRYAELNSIYGVFGCAGAEFYRRVIAPYEDEKIKQNGDVNGYDATES